MKIKHLQTKMLIFIMLPMMMMLAVIIILNYINTKDIYTNQLEANMKKKLQSYANDFNGFLLEKAQVAKDLAPLSQTIELINSAKYPMEDRHKDPLFMTTINDFLRLRTADIDKSILQIFMGLENTDEAYYDNWEKRKGTDMISIAYEVFQQDVIGKVNKEDERNFLLSLYSLNEDKTSYKLKGDISFEERKRILEIFRDIKYGYHVTARSWYKDVKKKKEFCFSNAYIDTSIWKPLVSALMPVFDKDNKMIGAVGADLLLDYLTEKIKELKIEGIENNYTFLIDNRGYYIAYAFPEDEDKYEEKIDVEDKKPNLINKIQKEKGAFVDFAKKYENDKLLEVGKGMEEVSVKLLTLANLSKNQIKEYNFQNYLAILKNIRQEKANEEDYKRFSEILSQIPRKAVAENKYLNVINKIFLKNTEDPQKKAIITEEDFMVVKNHLSKVSDKYLDTEQTNLKNDIIKQIDSTQKFEALDELYPKMIALGRQFELNEDLSSDEIQLMDEVIASIEKEKSFKFKNIDQYNLLKSMTDKYKKLTIPDFELVSFLPPKRKSVNAEDYYQKDPREYYLIFTPIPSVKWSIGLYVSKKQALQPVQEILQQSLILSGVAFLILIIVIIMLKGVILNPIQALARGMKVVEKGKFDAKVDVKTKDEIGQMTGIYNSMLDGLLERDTKLNHLINVSRTIVTETELQALLDLIMDKSTDLLEADVGTVFLYDSKREYLVHEVSKGLPPEIAKNMKFETGRGVVGQCAKLGQLLNIPDAYASELFDQETDRKSGYKTKNILCVPMKTTTGETIGVMELINKVGDKKFDENDEKLLGAFSSLAGISIENARALKEIKSTMNAFQLFVPPKFLKRIAKEGIGSIKVGNATQETISILFSDIRSFTSISEKMTPEGVFTFLNEYMEEMNFAIKANEGFIDKFIGDAIMALFDNPHADGAVNAGIGMTRRLREYNKMRVARGDFPIAIGCGVNTGSAIIGTLGSSDRMDSTVIGDCVNLASRLEGLTKMYGSALLISSFTKDALEHPENFLIREVDAVKVKGKEEAVHIYDVFSGDTDELIEAKQKSLPKLKEAISLYRARKWDDSMKLFKECKEIVKDDKVAGNFIEQIEEYKINPPSDGWDGSLKLDHK